MWYAFLADLLVALHAGYVAFVVVGQIFILLGVWLRWSWVRNVWFRLAHLLFILIVGLEAAFHIACPLTTWEDDLRRLAGQTVEEGTFVGRLLRSAIFYNFEPWVFDVVHISFAVLVLATFIAAPPRWRKVLKYSRR